MQQHLSVFRFHPFSHISPCVVPVQIPAVCQCVPLSFVDSVLARWDVLGDTHSGGAAAHLPFIYYLQTRHVKTPFIDKHSNIIKVFTAANAVVPSTEYEAARCVSSLHDPHDLCATAPGNTMSHAELSQSVSDHLQSGSPSPDDLHLLATGPIRTDREGVLSFRS